MRGDADPLPQEEQIGLLELEDKHAGVDNAFEHRGLSQHYHPRQCVAFILALPSLLFSYLGSISWRDAAVAFAWFLVPSFLQGRQAREKIRPAKLHPTAYLDGMRGLAALFVFFCHFSYQFFNLVDGFGFEGNHNILRLPIVRLLYDGSSSVTVFFAISGYALSYRPLKLARAGNFKDFATGLSSLTFRRGLRLYLPPMISTLWVVFLVRLGVYELTRDFAKDRTYIKRIMEPHPARLDSTWAQLIDWAKQVWGFVRVFDWDEKSGRMSYDVHLWTIPMELRCSFYLFLVILGTAHLQSLYRCLTLAFCSYFSYRHSRWELLVFFFGMAVAEHDLIRGAHVVKPDLPVTNSHSKSGRAKFARFFWIFTSVLGLYFLSQPLAKPEETPGWKWLVSLIPEWWEANATKYYHSAGAGIFMLSVSHLPYFQRFYNSFIVQYFGKISYAMYLMHGPAMHTMGYLFEKWAWSVTGVEGHQFNAGFILAACFCIPTVIWWADVFWRAVDIPTVRFAKWFDAKLRAKHD